MTIYVPGWMQAGSYSAQHDRINSAASMFDEGVNSRVDLKVTQRAAGANMTVDVAAGGCVITGDDTAPVVQGNYDVYSDAVGSVSGFVATSANTRYDLVVMQLNDTTAGGAAGNNAVLARVPGTQSASPVIPAVPNSALLLAIIGPFTTSTSSITNSMIHDAYTGTGPTGVTGARLCKGLRDTPGTKKDTFNPIAPNGWLIADGSAVSRSTYATLFEHFGTTFGAGNGSTTFNLPDLRGRTMVALDNQGQGDAARLAAANTLGGVGGEELHTLTTAELAAHAHTTSVSVQSADHTHSGTTNTESATHSHDYAGGGGVANVAAGAIPVTGTILGPTGTELATHTHPFTTAGMSLSHIHTVTVFNEGSGTAHNNMPPYILGYTIVRT